MFFLREQQYKSSKDDEISLTIAKNCIMGKVYNARWVLERAIRDHGMQIDVEGVKKASFAFKRIVTVYTECRIERPIERL